MIRTSTGSAVAEPTGRISGFLENAEELRLDLEGQLADLVEKERSAVGLPEVARRVAVGRRMGSSTHPEQLGLRQPRGNGGAVECHEGARAAALLMDVGREDLLSGAGLSVQEHLEPRPGDVLGLAHDPAHHHPAHHGAARPVGEVFGALVPHRAVDAHRAIGLDLPIHVLEDRVAEPHLVEVLEAGFVDELAIDEDPVSTPEVPQQPAAALAKHLGVSARNGPLGQHDVRGRRAPEGELVAVEGNHRGQLQEARSVEEHQAGLRCVLRRAHHVADAHRLRACLARLRRGHVRPG